MKFIRPLLILSGLTIVLAATALWWNRPTKADMSDYAPADSLVYIEINSVPNITSAIEQSDVWKAVAPAIGLNTQGTSTSTLLVSQLGLGPIQAVLASRAQFALVVVGVNTEEKDDSLHVKPEVALIAETHTSKWRMKSAVMDDIKRLAEFAYGSSVCTERNTGVDYVECVEGKGTRKIVGAIDGTVVIVGNSAKAVENCLAVRQGQRPSLRTDSEMLRLRRRLSSNDTLSFGYVSQANAAKLVSVGGPLMIGKAPNDQQLERLINDSASKILQGVSWTSTAKAGGIEDHYLISLDPNVTKRLRPAFQTSALNEDYWKLIPDSFRSVTVYKSNNPQAAWFSLDSAVAAKLDAVSSVIFASLLKSGLSGYGIDDPKTVIGALQSPVVTIRPILGEGALLLARVKDEQVLRSELSNAFLKEGKGQILNGRESDPAKEKEFTAVFIDGFVVLGKTESLTVYLTQLRNEEVITPEHRRAVERFDGGDAGITTYTNDRNLVTGTIAALSRFGGRTLTDRELTAISERVSQFELSCTESTLNEDGIDRRTQSAFGQFGGLISFAHADSATASPK